MYHPQSKSTNAQTANDAGFTLIEIMIAIVILTFGLVALMGASVYVSRANNTSNTLNILAASAQDQVDRLRSAVWTHTTEDSQITVGGDIAATNTGSDTTDTAPYLYTLDPNDAHHATVSNTPVGNLSLRWQVRQGGTADLRYVTVFVVQNLPGPGMGRGFTVSTIISRQD